MAVRLDKYLAQAGIGTRSEVKKLIRSGRVFLGCEAAKRPEDKIEEGMEVFVDGERVDYSEYEYYMLYKPAGVVSATQDANDKTVVELITCPHGKNLFPVGRLDKDTEGLLLLTDDGALAHDLLSPRKHVAKRYFVRAAGKIGEEEKTALEQGVDIGDEKLTKPAKVEKVHGFQREDMWQTELEIVITEGRYHQIKRMFQAVGAKVIYLKRLSMGSLALDETLALGEFRKLTAEEIDGLRKREEKVL